MAHRSRLGLPHIAHKHRELAEICSNDTLTQSSVHSWGAPCRHVAASLNAVEGVGPLILLPRKASKQAGAG